MASVPLTLRVHATDCAFPMCDTPQALDIGADGESGMMLVYRVSGEHRTLLDESDAVALLGRWLPAAWGIRPIVDIETMGLGDDSKWSCGIGGNYSVYLTTPKCGPPITIDALELLTALLVMGAPLLQKALAAVNQTTFREHSLAGEVTRVTRHNHRIHQIAQEVDEIDL